jgi:AraC-like DNA-binding protein
MKAPPRINALAPGIMALAPQEGRNETRYPGVTVWRVTSAEAPTPTWYQACLVLVGSGEKHGMLSDETFVYDTDHYLVVTSPLPMVCRTLASREEPVLTLAIGLDLELLRELLSEEAPPPCAPSPVFRAPHTPALADAGVRLLSHLGDERRTRLLARQTVREMLVHVLEGPFGDPLRVLARETEHRLGRVLQHMGARYVERLSVPDLARMAHMSVPTFHHHFREMTGTSPLQYLKTMRLTRARQLLHGGRAVKVVARDVGYESVSQFSREYRKLFGTAPSRSFSPDT